MSGILPMKYASAEDRRIGLQELQFLVTVNTSATFASASISTDLPGVAYAYLANAADPSSGSVDTAATFGTVTYNASPSQWACVLLLGGNKEQAPVTVVDVSTPVTSIVAGTSSMSAATYSLVGASTTGISTNNNICFVGNTTSCNFHSQTTTVSFWVKVLWTVKRV